MRASQSLQLFTAFLLYFSTFTAAFPWPAFLPEPDSLIVRRQNNNNNNENGGSSSTAATTSPSGTGSAALGTNTGNTTGSATTKATKTHHTSYDPRLPAGGIAMITPALTAGAQYYKVGQNVTFAWNYTSLSATPTALNIFASCSANQYTYTMAANQTIGNATGVVTWDTSIYSTEAVQLLTETYTLVIFDADSAITAAPQAGYLAPYAQYTFGMYVTQAYTSLAAGYQCATCSGALSDMERQALGFMLGMATITVMSSLWFIGGLNVIW